MSDAKLKKYIAFGDLQAEGQALEKLLPYIEDFKPDEIVIGGDFVDLDAISQYSAHKRRSRGIADVLKETKAELDWGKKTLGMIRKAAGPRCKITFIIGNHEDRLQEFFFEYPQMANGLCGIEESLGLKGLGINAIQLGGNHRIGKVYFMHGEGYNGDLFTKNAAGKCRKNVRLFHHHTNQSYMITSELDGDDKIEVKSVGCMCGMAPSYLKGQQNRWINSFLVGYVFPDGNFQDFTVNIINGRFVAPNGKVYGHVGRTR